MRGDGDLVTGDSVNRDSMPASPGSPSNLVRAWWPAALWVCLIAFESTPFFSADNTAGMLYRLLTRLFGRINYHTFFIFHHYLRKGGHVVGYGVLGVLLLRGWRATLDRDHVQLGRTALLSWLGTVFVATMDEWHQSYIPSRTGTWRDVVLDSAAGLIFLLSAYWWLRRTRPPV